MRLIPLQIGLVLCLLLVGDVAFAQTEQVCKQITLTEDGRIPDAVYREMVCKGYWKGEFKVREEWDSEEIVVIGVMGGTEVAWTYMRSHARVVEYVTPDLLLKSINFRAHHMSVAPAPATERLTESWVQVLQQCQPGDIPKWCEWQRDSARDWTGEWERESSFTTRTTRKLGYSSIFPHKPWALLSLEATDPQLKKRKAVVGRELKDRTTQKPMRHGFILLGDALICEDRSIQWRRDETKVRFVGPRKETKREVVVVDLKYVPTPEVVHEGEAAKFCRGTEDCDEGRLDAAREAEARAEQTYDDRKARWREAVDALEQRRDDYTDIEAKLRNHTQQTFATAASYIECMERFGEETLQNKLNDLRTVLINDCLVGEYDPVKCDPVQAKIQDLQQDKDFASDKCLGPEELYEEELAYWNKLYREDLPIAEGEYNRAAQKESAAAENLQRADERRKQAAARVEALEREYREKCASEKEE